MLNLIENLPRGSAYSDAMGADPEIAQAAHDGHIEFDETPRSPLFAEWSPEADLLARACDLLGVLIGAVVATTGTEPPKIRPTDRPTTAVAEAYRIGKELREKRDLLDLVRMLTPDNIPRWLQDIDE